jgi:hypothetical protein
MWHITPYCCCKDLKKNIPENEVFEYFGTIFATHTHTHTHTHTAGI